MKHWEKTCKYLTIRTSLSFLNNEIIARKVCISPLSLEGMEDFALKISEKVWIYDPPADFVLTDSKSTKFPSVSYHIFNSRAIEVSGLITRDELEPTEREQVLKSETLKIYTKVKIHTKGAS